MPLASVCDEEPRGDAVSGPKTRTCEKTGLVLVTGPSDFVWRIAKTSYGAMNPPLRQPDEDRRGWGRYDVLSHRTIYAARPQEAAYAESIAFARQKLSAIKIGDLFDESARVGARSLLDSVKEEWAERSHMPPGALPAGWRLDRLLFRLKLDPEAWFVDVEAGESVAVIRDQLASSWSTMGLEDFTVANLKAEDRAVTTAVSDWIWPKTLDDGSLPAGIRFRSKHGNDWDCWAVWLRRTDDDNPEAEVTTVSNGADIADPHHNDPLKRIARLFKITCH